MRLGIISDTHGQTANARRAVHLLESLEAETIIHCGDIGSPWIPSLFSPWPTHYVFGNVDEDRGELRAAIADAGHVCHDRFGTLDLDGVKIAFLHGDDGARLRATIDSGDWDLVCFGHTHRAEQRRVRRTLALNPGALYRASPHTLAIVDLPQIEVVILEV